MAWSRQSSLIALSSPVKVDLGIYKGDTGSFKITVKDENNNGINISGGTFDGDVRVSPLTANPLFSFTITPVVGDTSSITVDISAVNSNLLVDTVNPYYYDIQMTLAGKVTTLVAGLIYVTQDVSR
jgi:hypothetical protein